MRKLIVEEWISLDGFAEDANGKLDYFPTTKENRYADEQQLKFLDTVDTILLGRKTYELFVDYWPKASTKEEIIADRLNEIPKLVCSNTLKHAPWGKWPDATIAPGNAIDVVTNLKKQPGRNIILWGSLSLTQTLMKANLVDLYKLRICPTVVGGGRPLFPAFNAYQSLKLIEHGAYDSGLINLTYEPA